MREPIHTAPLPDVACVPLVEGTRASAQPLVTAGNPVQTGQPVARHGDGTLIHAPVGGRIIAVESRVVPAAGSRPAPCILIQREGDDHWHASCQPVAALVMTREEICARIAEGGIVGLGGALFPTATKLAPGAPVRALILDGAECEPWISCDEMLMRERAQQVVNGARVMMQALGTEQVVIAVESDMPEARIALDDVLRAEQRPGMGIAVVTAKYPAGGERQLIEMITGEEVPTGRHPRDIGYVCQNVGTAAAVGEWFYTGRPLISRIVTVTGSGVARPGNFDVRIGTPILDLIELAGGYVDEPHRLIVGGPMMGVAIGDDAAPVTKATNCVAVATAADLAHDTTEMPCIRCGDCVEACPARLLPHELFAALRRDDHGEAFSLGLADCIECGCCDYVCPSAIHMTTRFVAAKRRHLRVAEPRP